MRQVLCFPWAVWDSGKIVAGETHIQNWMHQWIIWGWWHFYKIGDALPFSTISWLTRAYPGYCSPSSIRWLYQTMSNKRDNSAFCCVFTETPRFLLAVIVFPPSQNTDDDNRLEENLTYLQSWDILEKLPIVQPVGNFPAFYLTRRFITVFTTALHWSLSWTTSIQSIPSHPISQFFLICGVGLWVLRPLTGLLYQLQMIVDGDCGEIGGMNIGKGNRITWRKPAPASLCPPKIPHD
jgi:hypothetical protein